MASEKNIKTQKIEQFTGEIVLYIPIIILFITLDYLLGTELFYTAIIVILSTIVMRQFFTYSYHTKKGENMLCITISYISILILTLSGYLIKNHPMYVVILCGIFCYINNYIGEQVYKLYKLENKTLTEMTDEEFNKFCRHKNLSETEIIIANLIIREQLKGQDLANACNYSLSQTKRYRKSIKIKLNI